MKKLPKEIDRTKIYFKVTNEKENHYGLQYHDGLVEDIIPFNDNSEDSRVEGGIYFTDLENIYEFFDYGCYIRPLRIPDDARVVLDPKGNKYRADKVFMLPKLTFKEFFDKYFDDNTFDYENYSYVLAQYCPQKINPEKYNWGKYSH